MHTSCSLVHLSAVPLYDFNESLLNVGNVKLICYLLFSTSNLVGDLKFIFIFFKCMYKIQKYFVKCQSFRWAFYFTVKFIKKKGLLIHKDCRFA
jgi:hypothetical protein